jgi:hypothetical protein
MRHARTDELTDRGIEHDYVVLFPSGQRLTLRGIFVALVVKGESLFGIRVGEELFVLDPRALVTRRGLIIADPRRRPVPAWAQQWLAEHPEWPACATEASE